MQHGYAKLARGPEDFLNVLHAMGLPFDVLLGAHFWQPGYETDLLYIAGLIALYFGGAGPFSVDGILGQFLLRPWRTRSRPAL
jgi:hypothetical protein